MSTQRFRFAWRAFGWHLLVSCAVALLVSLLVFAVWYPTPYATMVGGVELFKILIGVDIVCGPLLTFVLFNPQKSRRELTLDLGFVAVLQCIALGYGVHTMWQARPVYLVYEIDRFYVISPASIAPEDWEKVPSNVSPPSWSGPQMLATRVAKEDDPDYSDQLQLSLDGLAPAYRPDRWMPYEQAAQQLRERAQPLEALDELHPTARWTIDKGVKDAALDKERIRWLPVQTKNSVSWSVLLDVETLRVIGFLPLSGFKD